MNGMITRRVSITPKRNFANFIFGSIIYYDDIIFFVK